MDVAQHREARVHTHPSGAARRLPAALAAIACAGLILAAPALAADTIYWSNGGDNTIGYASLDGAGGGTLDLSGATPDTPAEIAIDPAGGLIFWVSRANDEIQYARLSGGGGGTLSTSPVTPDYPDGLAIDPANGRIYWSNGSNNTIEYASIGGGGGGTLNLGSAPIEGPSGLAIDPSNGRIYWVNNGNDTIGYANLDGSGGGAFDTSGASFNYPTGIAIDPALGKVFWTSNSGGPISFANLDGSGGGGTLDTTGVTIFQPEGIAVDESSGRVYFPATSGIGYANANGSGGGGLLSTTGATFDDQDYPALLQAPVAGAAPAISGNAFVGSTLTCSQGSWSSDLLSQLDYLAPQSFLYSWALNGTTLTGASAGTLTPTSAGSYTCTVSAVNQAGATAQTSAAITVVEPTPAITALTVSPHRFRAASAGASIARKHATGASVGYDDSQAATTTFTVFERASGYRAGGSCHAARPSGRRKPKRCSLLRRVGAFTHTDTAGADSFHFTGRVGGHALKPGAYELQAVPVLAGTSGVAVTAAFAIRSS